MRTVCLARMSINLELRKISALYARGLAMRFDIAQVSMCVKWVLVWQYRDRSRYVANNRTTSHVGFVGSEQKKNDR